MVTSRHFCGICKKGYSKEDDAIDCEAQGIIGAELTPGLTLKRNIEDKKLHEKLFVILQREYPNSVKFRHYVTYRVGQVDFGDGTPYSWNRWAWGLRKSQDIEIDIRNRELSVLTERELNETRRMLIDWARKIDVARSDGYSGAEPYKGCVEPEIIKSLKEYGIEDIHTENPF